MKRLLKVLGFNALDAMNENTSELFSFFLGATFLYNLNELLNYSEKEEIKVEDAPIARRKIFIFEYSR